MKKNKMKLKVFAGLVALTLASTPITLAKADYYSGKNVVIETVQFNAKNFDQEKFENYFAETNISNCDDFGVTHMHAYVDDNGNIVKWLSSEQLEIDGLHWTEQRKEIELFEAIEDEIKEPHAHLYYSETSYYLIPIYSEEEVIDGEFIKLAKTVFLPKEKCDELMETGLFRVYDNIEQLQKAYDVINYDSYYKGYDHFMTLSPVYINDKVIDMRNKFYTITNDFSEEHYGELLYPEGFVADEEKMKNSPTYVEVEKVKGNQRDTVITKDYADSQKQR